MTKQRKVQSLTNPCSGVQAQRRVLAETQDVGTCKHCLWQPNLDRDWKTIGKSKKEPHCRTMLSGAVDKLFNTEIYCVNICAEKHPTLWKSKIPPLQNSARSDSKYIGEKPSVMLWYFNCSTKTGTHRRIRSKRSNCWFNYVWSRVTAVTCGEKFEKKISIQ